jgi:hypothetical protein
MKLTRGQLAFDGLWLTLLISTGIAVIYRSITSVDTEPLWGLYFGVVILVLAGVPVWHVWSVRGMPDPPLAIDRVRQTNQALIIGICLVVLSQVLLLLALAVNVVERGSGGTDVILAAGVVLTVPALFVFIRMRQQVQAARSTLRYR